MKGLESSKVQLPAAFKGSIAFGVQGFKGSIACGVQRFNCLWRSRVQLPAAFKGSRVQCLRRSGVHVFEEVGVLDLGFGIWLLRFGIWDLDLGS